MLKKCNILGTASAIIQRKVNRRSFFNLGRFNGSKDQNNQLFLRVASTSSRYFIKRAGALVVRAIQR